VVAQHDPVVFFHVMKCGGTSVRAALAKGALAPIDDAETSAPDGSGAKVAAGGTHPEISEPVATEGTAAQVAPGATHAEIFELDGTAAKVAAGGAHADNWRFRDALLLYVLQAMRPSLVLGHFRYRDRCQELADSAHFVTVLRDPVERMVSLYKYRRYKDGIDVAVSTDFEEFIATKRWMKEGHAYVDVFSGTDDLDPRSDEAIAAAVANLRRFAVVGFTDRLEDFSSQVSSLWGREVSIPILNQSPAPELPESEIGAGALEQARVVCEPDIRVYEQALAVTV